MKQHTCIVDKFLGRHVPRGRNGFAMQIHAILPFEWILLFQIFTMVSNENSSEENALFANKTSYFRDTKNKFVAVNPVLI